MRPTEPPSGYLPPPGEGPSSGYGRSAAARNSVAAQLPRRPQFSRQQQARSHQQVRRRRLRALSIIANMSAAQQARTRPRASARRGQTAGRRQREFSPRTAAVAAPSLASPAQTPARNNWDLFFRTGIIARKGTRRQRA